MPYLMKRKDDGKLVPMGRVSESMAWLFRELKGREFDVEEISQLLQKQYNMPSQQADAEAIMLTINWRRMQMLEDDLGSAEKLENAMLFLLKGALWGKAKLSENVFSLST